MYGATGQPIGTFSGKITFMLNHIQDISKE